MNNETAMAADSPIAPARVVAVEEGQVWLEPMQTGSCGSCASAALCGSKGIGSLTDRLEARRFAVPGQFDLVCGDVVDVAFSRGNLLQAAALAYLLPLVISLLCAIVVDSRFGRDAWTLLAALLGLVLGFLVMRYFAQGLAQRGDLQAQILRRHEPVAPVLFHGKGTSV